MKTEMKTDVVAFLPRGAIPVWYIADGQTLYLLPSGMYVSFNGTTVGAVKQSWAAQQHLVGLMSEMVLTPHAAAAMLHVPVDLVIRWWGGEETVTEDVIIKLQRRSWERAR